MRVFWFRPHRPRTRRGGGGSVVTAQWTASIAACAAASDSPVPDSMAQPNPAPTLIDIQEVRAGGE